MSDQKLDFPKPVRPSSNVTAKQVLAIAIPMAVVIGAFSVFLVSVIKDDAVYRGNGQERTRQVPHDFSLHCKPIDTDSKLDGGFLNIEHNSYAVYADHLMQPGTAATEYVCQHLRGIIFSFGHCGLTGSIHNLFALYAPNSTCQEPDAWLYAMNTHVRNCYRGVPRYINLTTISHTHFVISCDASTGLGILMPTLAGFRGAFCADLEIAIDANTKGISGTDCTTRAELDRLYGELGTDINNCTGGAYAGVTTWQANYDALRCSEFVF